MKGLKESKEWMDFTPRDEKDYFTLLWWRIGRKLGYVILLAFILSCIIILLLMDPLDQLKNIRTYPIFSYDSLLLKFYKGKAGIRAEDGHIAYVGKVSKGKANGKGILYDSEENVIYEGSFSDSLYQGKGILYRAGFVKEYEGGFRNGMKHGKGKLYDGSASLIFTGNFSGDKIVFEEMAGKPTSDLSEKYKGGQAIYNKQGRMCVVMEDIGAVYYAVSDAGSLEGDWQAEGIYVLENAYAVRNKILETGSQLQAYFGKPLYQGTTAVQFGDAVAFNQALQAMSEEGDRIDAEGGSWIDEGEGSRIDAEGGSRVDEGEGSQINEGEGSRINAGEGPRIDAEEGLRDVYEVTGFDAGYEVYVTVYEKEGFHYTFFSGNREKETFLFYLIELAE